MVRNEPGSEADYAAMAAEIERGDYEIVPDSTVISPRLRMGRPVGSEKRGVSPIRNVRLPGEMDARVRTTAAAEGITPSELIRTAVAEYLDRHSA